MHITHCEKFNTRGRTYHTDGRMLFGVYGCSGNNGGYRFTRLAKKVDANLLELFLSIPGVYSVSLEEKTVEIWIRDDASWEPIHAKLEELIEEMEPIPNPPAWN